MLRIGELEGESEFPTPTSSLTSEARNGRIATAAFRPCDHDAMRKLAAGLLTLALALVSCRGSGDPAPTPRPQGTTLSGSGSGSEPAPSTRPRRGATVRFLTAGGTVELTGLEIADSDEERIHGLMGRKHLPLNGGMLFVFEGSVREPFWMKNTLIPLSIAFWNEDGIIVAILDMQPCQRAWCRKYRPSEDFVAALEMHIGSFQRLGIREGDTADVELP